MFGGEGDGGRWRMEWSATEVVVLSAVCIQIIESYKLPEDDGGVSWAIADAIVHNASVLRNLLGADEW